MINVVIVGGGCSGAVLAINLARMTSAAQVTITMIDPSIPGRGVAYGTQLKDHWLNVPAKSASIDPDTPDDFVDWWAARIGVTASSLRFDYAPRPVYATYLAERFATIADRVNVRQTRAVGARHDNGRWTVQLADNTEISADHMVLAMGNGLPQPTAFGFCDPWNLPDRVDPDAPAFILGTGLTMIDAVMSLEARGHRGPILALSRRGLVPRIHDRSVYTLTPLTPPRNLIDQSPVAVMQWIRSQITDGHPWRLAIDSLRSVTPEIWRGWTPFQQRQFLRHLQSRWDVHRHRMAPEIADKLAFWTATGRLKIVAGRIDTVTRDAGTWRVDWHARGGGQPRQYAAALAIDCSGRRTDPSAATSCPFVQSLLTQGMVRPDVNRLGFDQDGQNHLVDAQGEAQPTLWGMGPLLRGYGWECTAVPEIRVEARALARQIVNADPQACSRVA